MEYKRIFIQFDPYRDIQSDDLGDTPETCNIYEEYFSTEGQNSKAADLEISKLLNEGWKIVSTCPVTCSLAKIDKSIVDNPFTLYYTCTDGIEVFLIKE